MNFDSKIPTLKFQHSQIHRVTHNSVKYILHVLLSVKYLGGIIFFVLHLFNFNTIFKKNLSNHKTKRGQHMHLNRQTIHFRVA